MYSGTGLVIGAALGLLVGTLFSATVWVAPLIGAVVGLLIGAVADSQHPKS